MGAAVLFPAGAVAVLALVAVTVWFARAALDSAEETEPRYLLKDLAGMWRCTAATARAPWPSMT